MEYLFYLFVLFVLTPVAFIALARSGGAQSRMDLLDLELARLRQQLEEAKAREKKTAQAAQASVAGVEREKASPAKPAFTPTAKPAVSPSAADEEARERDNDLPVFGGIRVEIDRPLPPVPPPLPAQARAVPPAPAVVSPSVVPPPAKVAAPVVAAAAMPPVPPQLPPLPMQIAPMPAVPAQVAPRPAPPVVPAPVAPPPMAASTLPPPPKIPFVEAARATVAAEPPKPVERNREARLGAWWATRLGIAFLVIAVVFFGIYVSQQAQPWVRLLEVGILAGLVTGLGRWLERKAPVYGQVIFAGGLSLFYFTAYAAYAVKPMQVVTTLPAGLVLQFAAVAGLTAVAWRRDRSSIAAMSLFLGTLSCLFALSYHFEVTLMAAFGLLLVGAALRVARGWTWPLGFAYAGAQACFVGAVMTAIGHTLDPAMIVEGALQNHPLGGIGPTANGPAFTLFFPTGLFLVLVVADIWAQSRAKIGARLAREWSVRVATVAYGLTGWWGGGTVGGEAWAAHNLLAAAGACAMAGVIYVKRRDLPALIEMFFTAAASWLAVYLLLEYAGWVRWSALLAEAFILASWVRRRPAVLPSLGLMGAWMLSGVMAAWAAIHVGDAVPAWDAQRLVFLVWALASVGLWTWLESAKRETLSWELALRNFGGAATAMGAVALGLMAWKADTQTWLFLGLAVAAAGIGLAARGREVWKTAGTALVASWVVMLVHTNHLEWYHWAMALGEAYVLAGWARRRGQPWVAGFMVAAWAVSGWVAGTAASALAPQLLPWAYERWEFLAWPLASVGLWTWLEKSPRELLAWELELHNFGGVGTAAGAVVLGWLAWTGDTQTWLFLALAVATALPGLAVNVRQAWKTAGTALVASWITLLLNNHDPQWYHWALPLAEAFVLGHWARRREQPWVSGLMAAAWTVSGLVAGLAAFKLSPQLAPWALGRLEFLAWPLASVGLWTWLESSSRASAAWELDFRNHAGSATAVGAVALGWLAWTAETQTWLFLALAATTAVVGLALNARQSWKTAGTALAASWVTLLLYVPHPQTYHWLALLAEAALLAAWMRRREQPWVAAFFGGAWTMSLVVAGECAYQLPMDLSPWALERVEFIFWPLVSMVLWTWLEHSPRPPSDEYRQKVKIGAAATALGAIALGVLAWTGLAETWLFVGLAALAWGLGQFTRAQAAHYTAGGALLAALWTFQPLAHAATGDIIWPLLVLTAAVVAGTWEWQRRVQEVNRNWGHAAEITYFLSLLKAWIIGLNAGAFAPELAPVVLTTMALGLGFLAWRGPWRMAGDLAWFWALAGWVEWEVYAAPNPVSHGSAWLCLGIVVALSWVWGALARQEKQAVFMLRLDILGQFLPALLLAGWTYAAPSPAWPASAQMLVIIVAAAAFAQVARREWLPSGAATAILLSAYGWWLAVSFTPTSLADCVAPAVALVAFLQMGWLLRRRVLASQLTDKALVKPLLILLALAALAAFDVPTWQLGGEVRQRFLTFLWAVAGGTVFIGGLAGRVKQYRYVGLAGLLLCLPRLFFVDITNPLGRIIAFGALAVVFLAIGFSYDRLRVWLDDDGQPPAPPKNPA